MKKIWSSTPLFWLVGLALLWAGIAQAASFDCAKASTVVEKMICADAKLSRLDREMDDLYKEIYEKLGNIHLIAQLSDLNKNSLHVAQQKWLRMVRDKCDDTRCLISVYRKRINDILDIFVSSLQVSEKPMSDEEAEEICIALSTLADDERLSSLAIPGRYQSSVCEEDTKSLWAISPEEQEKLTACVPYTCEAPRTIFKIHLTEKSVPARFARFFTGGSCAAYRVFNIYYLLNSNVDDIGVDEMSDPDQIRWPYIANDQYPIFFRGRNYMVNAYVYDSNMASMISWIKPDGRMRPLCLLATDSAKMKVISAENPELCSRIANGTMQPLEWEPVAQAIPFNHDSQGYWSEFVKRYGDYANEIGLLSIDIDGDGKLENVGKFVHESGSGCGSTRTWLSVLSKDLGEIESGILNDQFEKLAKNHQIDVYKVDGHYFISLIKDHRDAHVVQIIDGKVEQVCAFRQQKKTTIDKLFK